MSADDTVRYPLAENTLESAEMDAAMTVLRSGRVTLGDTVRRFESLFADWIGSPDAVMVNSGSSANLVMVEAMMRGLSVERRWAIGDEVIVPALAWPTTVWPVAQLGLVPVFVDVDAESLAIDPKRAADAITDRTRGVFLTHVLGQSADMAVWTEFRDKNDVVILEDACESLGAHWDDRHVGTFGPMGSFSTYFSHHITTVEGGFVAVGDAELADDLRGIRAHGWARNRSDQATHVAANPDIDERFLFVQSGYNVRPTEIQAAIGIHQLERLDGMLEMRDDLAREVIAAAAAAAPWLRVIGADRLGGGPMGRSSRTNSWMNIAFETMPGAPASKSRVVAALESAGVDTRPIIAGNFARHPGLALVEHRLAGPLEVSDGLLDNGFMIGCHPGVSGEQKAVLLAAIEGLAQL